MQNVTLIPRHFKDPMELVHQWYEDASKTDEPLIEAACLSTLDPQGLPNSRMVLVKDIAQQGLRFFTHYESPKALEIKHHDGVSLVFHWKALERQIRIQGHCIQLSHEENTQYFQARPLESQIAATISPQSKELKDRTELVDAFEQLKANLPEGCSSLPCPEQWGGYRVEPTTIEFWQGMDHRMHDRVRYAKTDQVWSAQRLAP